MWICLACLFLLFCPSFLPFFFTFVVFLPFLSHSLSPHFFLSLLSSFRFFLPLPTFVCSSFFCVSFLRSTDVLYWLHSTSGWMGVCWWKPGARCILYWHIRTEISLPTEVVALDFFLRTLYWNIATDGFFCTGMFLLAEHFILEYSHWNVPTDLNMVSWTFSTEVIPEYIYWRNILH